LRRSILKKEDSILAQIMTTQDMAKYLKLHPITISKFAKEGKIPSFRIGRAWRFDKDVIDKWISGNQKELPTKKSKARVTNKLRKRQSSQVNLSNDVMITECKRL
jgi:excisionase family DNA binding protein